MSDLSSLFQSPFSLKSMLSRQANTNEDDVIAVKNGLKNLGHYEIPDYGMTPYPDNALFDGIKNFQTQNGLKADGVMKPGGETESKMAQVLSEKKTDAFNDPFDGMPESKRGMLSKADQLKAWNIFGSTLKTIPEMGERQYKAMRNTLAMEGINESDPSSTAKAGILQPTLDGLINQKRLDARILGDRRKTSQLKPEDIAHIYPAYMEDVMSRNGGRKALEDIKDDTAASAYFDTLFQHGRGGGSLMIQRAINRMEPKTVEEDGGMGLQTWNAYLRLANDPQKLDKFMDALADIRTEGEESRGGVLAGNRIRYDSFRRKKK